MEVRQKGQTCYKILNKAQKLLNNQAKFFIENIAYRMFTNACVPRDSRLICCLEFYEQTRTIIQYVIRIGVHIAQ